MWRLAVTRLEITFLEHHVMACFQPTLQRFVASPSPHTLVET